jgi:hypothetical protein
VRSADHPLSSSAGLRKDKRVAGRVVAGRVVAGRVVAGRVVAGR